MKHKFLWLIFSLSPILLNHPKHQAHVQYKYQKGNKNYQNNQIWIFEKRLPYLLSKVLPHFPRPGLILV